MTKFDNIKVGDKVVESVYSRLTAHTVTHVTPKFFDAGGERWRRKDGAIAKRVSTWNLRSVRMFSPDDQPLLDKTAAWILVDKLIKKLPKATLEQLRQVERVLSQTDTAPKGK